MRKLTKLMSRAAVMTAFMSAAAAPSVAPAQSAAEWAERDRHCMALRTLQTEEHLRLKEEWVRGTFPAIDARNQDECRELYEEAVQALEAEEPEGTIVRTDDGPLAPLR